MTALRKPNISKEFCRILLYTFVSGLIAHAYCYFGSGFSHDALCVFQVDVDWQIALGRFLQPLYKVCRWFITAPWLLGVTALLFTSVSAHLIIKLTGIKSKLSTALICAILTVNLTVTAGNAAYITWADVFALASLLAILAVYLLRTKKLGFLFGSLLIAASLAIYQSYITVAVCLSMLLIFQDILNKTATKAVVTSAIKAIIMLLLGGIIYAILLKIVLLATSIELADTYNGLTSMVAPSDSSLLALLFGAYKYFLAFFFSPALGYNNPLAGSPYPPLPFMTVINALLLLTTIIATIVLIVRRRISTAGILMLLAIMLLLPLGCNATFVLSKGMVHHLMVYSFFIVYLFAFIVFNALSKELDGNELKHTKPITVLSVTALITVSLVILNGIVYANGAYLKKELEASATLSAMTRLAEKIDDTQGYSAGETPVAFIGFLQDNDLYSGDAMLGFSRYSDTLGMGENVAVTYYLTYAWYFDYVLGYPINVVDEETAQSYYPLCDDIDAYPSDSCCKMLDGVLLIKLSD